MARITQIPIIAMTNVHRFQHFDTLEIVQVECTDREYEALTKKGAGPPAPKFWPSPRSSYVWRGSTGGVAKFDVGKYGPHPGEMYARDGRFRIRPHDGVSREIVTEPTRDTVTGDTTRTNTTITISPDPQGWRVVNGDLTAR